MNSNVRIGDPFATRDPNARRKLLSNNLATAYAAGSPRESLKTYDRPGLSRAAAQANQAGIDSARAVSEGVASAYQQDDALATAAANSNLRNAAAQEGYANQLTALQQQDAYSRRLAALQAQQQRMNFVTGLLGGLLR